MSNGANHVSAMTTFFADTDWPARPRTMADKFDDAIARMRVAMQTARDACRDADDALTAMRGNAPRRALGEQMDEMRASLGTLESAHAQGCYGR